MIARIAREHALETRSDMGSDGYSSDLSTENSVIRLGKEDIDHELATEGGSTLPPIQ